MKLPDDQILGTAVYEIYVTFPIGTNCKSLPRCPSELLTPQIERKNNWLIAVFFQDQPQHINRNGWNIVHNIVHNIHVLYYFIIFSGDLPEKSENLRQP